MQLTKIETTPHTNTEFVQTQCTRQSVFQYSCCSSYSQHQSHEAGLHTNHHPTITELRPNCECALKHVVTLLLSFVTFLSNTLGLFMKDVHGEHTIRDQGNRSTTRQIPPVKQSGREQGRSVHWVYSAGCREHTSSQGSVGVSSQRDGGEGLGI